MNTSEQNYKMIRKTAMKLFQEKGFDNVSVKDICDVSGVPRRSFYTLFKNKDELILSYFHFSDELINDVDSFHELLMLNDPYSKLIAIVRVYLNLLEKNGPYFLSQIYRIGTQGNETALFGIADGLKEISCKIIEECQKNGSILNQTEPELLWESLASFLIGICYIWCCGEPFPLEENALSRFEVLANTKPELRQYHSDTTIFI